MTLYGNAWDSTTLGTDFAAAFTGTTTDSTTSTLTWTWTVSDTEVYDDNGDRIYMATGTDASGNRLLVQVFKDDGGFTDMKVTYLEAYNKSDLTDWTDANKTAFTTAFGDTDKASLPFVYLGTKTPTVSVNSAATTSITISGGAWNDQVLDDAADVFTKDKGWTSERSGDKNNFAFFAYKKLDSGASFRIFLYATAPDDTAHIAMDVFYDPALTATNAVNLTATDWPTSVKDKIVDYCGYNLPYFGVPALPSNGYQATKAYNISTYSLSDTAGNLPYFTWALQAKSDMEKAGGTVDISLTGRTEGHKIDGWTLYAKLPVDKNDDTKGFFLLSFYAYISSYSSSASGSYNIYFNYYPKFDNSKGTDWSASNKKKMAALFGEDVPYVYLGTTKPTVAFDYGAKTMTVTGLTWDDSIFTAAETAFPATGGWTVDTNSVAYGSKAFSAKKTTDKGTVDVVIYDSVDANYGFSVPVMEVSLL